MGGGASVCDEVSMGSLRDGVYGGGLLGLCMRESVSVCVRVCVDGVC